MNPLDYVVEVQRLLSPHASSRTCQLGLLGESGEVADLVKKTLERGRLSYDQERLIEELGDVLWYLTAKLVIDASPVEAVGVLSGRVPYCGDQSVEDLAVDLCDSANALGKTRSVTTTIPAAREVFNDIASIGNLLNVMPRELMEWNVAKLRARHPDGFKVAS